MTSRNTQAKHTHKNKAKKTVATTKTALKKPARAKSPAKRAGGTKNGASKKRTSSAKTSAAGGIRRAPEINKDWVFIVTGFDAFGVSKTNPSEDMVKVFPEILDVRGFGNVPVDRLVLTTCCNEGWRPLNAALKRHKKSRVVLVMLGVAENRYKITLERLALNLRDYRIKDNKGHRFPAQKIDENVENAIFTTLPVDDISKTVKKKGIPCEVSNHAGTFVCNETYFKALKYQAENEHLEGVVFIHIPPPKHYQETIDILSGKTPKKRVQKKQALMLMTAAIEDIVRECLKKA